MKYLYNSLKDKKIELEKLKKEKKNREGLYKELKEYIANIKSHLAMLSSKYDYPISYITDDIEKIFNRATGMIKMDVASFDYDIKALEKQINK